LFMEGPHRGGMNSTTFAIALCALSAPAVGQSFTVMPAGAPTNLGGIALSAGGNSGVLGVNTFWDAPTTFTTITAGADVSRVSPNGFYALGRSTTQSRAARFNRTNGVDLIPNASSGLVPNTAYASSSGDSTVVGYGLLNGATTRAFIWQPGVGTGDAGVLLGDRSSVLLDVSSSGSVAVGWGEPSFGGPRHPLLYASGSGWSRLSAGGGFIDGGEARAVSANGLVVVGTYTVGGTIRGFRWTQGGFINLASPADPTNVTLETQAFDVSADGQWTVGRAQDTAASGSGLIATVWDAQGTPYRLSTLLGNEPIHQPFSLRTATSVSDDGRTVSGTAFDPGSGQLRVYVATWTSTTGGGCAPDLGGAGGVSGRDGSLDNNDFIVFINDFFQSSMSADFGTAGGAAGQDGVLDNNDFIAFINAFFAGCNG
ncbi:MAG: hypothetical protein K2Q09_10615, partial [Phycisphaerales bacterium]|nr:hypothetical protein [Phycisphaerales bacterium]